MSSTSGEFQPCEICGSSDWHEAYRGTVRSGSYGSWREGADIRSCAGCGVRRLAERDCIDSTAYETEQYRDHLGQGVEMETYHSLHDPLQLFSLRVLRPEGLRAKWVADVGAAGGSFLDAVSGYVDRAIAIEPCEAYHDILRAKQYDVFHYAKDAVASYNGALDYVTSFQVIEHVADPRRFLEELAPLLKDDGLLVISTPNLNDVLMRTADSAYAPFFYRVAHRWYFDEESLGRCAELAGYRIERVRYIHRYPLSNYLLWLRDERPCGNRALPEIDQVADDFWRAYLESKGLADTLFMECRRN